MSSRIRASPRLAPPRPDSPSKPSSPPPESRHLSSSPQKAHHLTKMALDLVEDLKDLPAIATTSPLTCEEPGKEQIAEGQGGEGGQGQSQSKKSSPVEQAMKLFHAGQTNPTPKAVADVKLDSVTEKSLSAICSEEKHDNTDSANITFVPVQAFHIINVSKEMLTPTCEPNYSSTDLNKYGGKDKDEVAYIDGARQVKLHNLAGGVRDMPDAEIDLNPKPLKIAKSETATPSTTPKKIKSRSRSPEKKPWNGGPAAPAVPPKSVKRSEEKSKSIPRPSSPPHTPENDDEEDEIPALVPAEQFFIDANGNSWPITDVEKTVPDANDNPITGFLAQESGVKTDNEGVTLMRAGEFWESQDGWTFDTAKEVEGIASSHPVLETKERKADGDAKVKADADAQAEAGGEEADVDVWNESMEYIEPASIVTGLGSSTGNEGAGEGDEPVNEESIEAPQSSIDFSANAVLKDLKRRCDADKFTTHPNPRFMAPYLNNSNPLTPPTTFSDIPHIHHTSSFVATDASSAAIESDNFPKQLSTAVDNINTSLSGIEKFGTYQKETLAAAEKLRESMTALEDEVAEFKIQNMEVMNMLREVYERGDKGRRCVEGDDDINEQLAGLECDVAMLKQQNIEQQTYIRRLETAVEEFVVLGVCWPQGDGVLGFGEDEKRGREREVYGDVGNKAGRGQGGGGCAIM